MGDPNVDACVDAAGRSAWLAACAAVGRRRCPVQTRRLADWPLPRLGGSEIAYNNKGDYDP
jgi:hypothetical protein